MTDTNMLINKANILIEALPYIQRLAGKLVVIKYGGNAMLDDDLMQKVLQDITLLKYVGVNPILVHGGGPDISNMLKDLNVESKFHNGLRITDKKTMEIAQMVLVGKTNKNIVSKLNLLGGKAIGLCGKDANLIEVERAEKQDGVDLGYVGKVTKINTELLHFLSSAEYIPVIAPIGIGPDGESYNINADTVAGEIAGAMQAEKMMFLTDIDGIREVADDPATLIPIINPQRIDELITSGIISGGMIPKVLGCIECINRGVNRVHILDGTVPHPILLEIFTDKGVGTMVVK
ncbi:acetylglutamate kinase [Clostridia bacterium OttesenSCG-928-F22]|nr:acetylglutamate kinase [Clostridia bacterium OttesenSCG-928-F22]